MNNNSIHRIEKLRVKLNPIQSIGHYSFAIFPLIIISVDFYYKITSKPVVNTFSEIAYLICFGLSGFILYLKYQELIIDRLYVKRSNKEFKEAVLATANKMKWSIEYLNNNGMKAISSNDWGINNWSNVSIYKTANYVEIKSIYKLFLSPPDIIGINKKYRMNFLNNYILSNQITNLNDKVVEELKAEEQRIENEPEWSLINTIKRVIAYVISLIFLAIGIGTWRYEGFSLIVLVFLIIGLSYIVFDIYVIRTKNKRASSS